MPGVPSGRACETCRSQKKKCDLQQPTCTRCRKAKIPCIGAGQRRFKFVDSRWTADSQQLQLAHHRASIGGPCHDVPSNESSRLARALVTQLGPADDIRYSITWLWGPYMPALPRRIGSNGALDAATATVVGIHHDLCTFSAENDKRLPEYTKALKAIRLEIKSQNGKHTPETLCAVMMLSMCSVLWAGPIMNFASPHGQGAAEMLKLQGFPVGQNPFEAGLYDKLRAAVAVQTIVDPEIHFSERHWRSFEASFQGDQPRSKLMRCTVRIGEMMVDAREAIPGSPEEQAVYDRATELQRKLDGIVLELKNVIYNNDTYYPDPVNATTEHARRQRNFNHGLIVCGLLLCVRRVLLPPDHDISEELNLLSSRVLALAEEAKVYRPLGGNWAIISLMAAWCAVKGTPTQSVMEDVMFRWREDFRGEETKPSCWIPRKDLLDLYQRLSLGRG